MKKLTALLLSLIMLMTMIAVPAIAADEDVTLKITPDKTTVVPGDTITYTISVEVKSADIKIGSMQFTLSPNSGMTLPTAFKVSGESVISYSDKSSWQYNAEEETGMYEIFSYTPASKVFLASNTTEQRALNTNKEIMKIKATVANDATGSLTLSADNVEFGKVDGGVTKWNYTVETTSVTIQSTPSHTHSWSTEWSSDATYHWHKCTGTGTCDAGNVKDKAEHTWTAATCTAPKTCAACGYTEGSALGHNYTEKIEDDAHLKKAATKCTEYNEYWYDCSRCDANAKNDTAATGKYFTSTTAKGSHNFTEKKTTAAYYVAGTGADCQHAKEYYYACADCNAVGTDKWTSTTKGPHSFDTTTWGYKGSDGHAHKCTVSGCTEHDTVVAHTPGAAATETTPQTCTECGYVIAPATGHIRHTLTNHPANPATCTEAGNIEYWTCSGCNDKFSDADGTNKITGSVTIAALGHDHSGPWVTTDENEHWKVCAREGCNEQLDKAAHSYADGSDTCGTCQHVREVTPPTDTVKVTFDANGGMFADQTTSKTIALDDWQESPVPTRSNYSFDGWYTARVGGSKVEEPQRYNENTTLYAHWTYIGGDGSITIITHPDNDTTGTKENPGTGAAPSGIGYVFVGLAAVGALCFGAKKLIKKEEE